MSPPKNGLYRNLMAACIFVLGILGILASGGGGGGDGNTTYNYTVTSTNYLTGGQQVAVVRFGISGSCSGITGITSAVTRVGAGTVSTPGTVSFSYTTNINPPMVESVYIDNNASGNLDPGDRVWGDDPNDLFGVCFDNFGTTQWFDWEIIAAQIQTAFGLSQPSVIYTGAAQTFRSDQERESGLLVMRSMPAEGDGYSNRVPITIEIMPGTAPDTIDPMSSVAISVAALGSVEFDAAQIDSSSVRFGIAEATPILDGEVADVNGDGFPDLLIQFQIRDTGIACGDVTATLTGETFDGTQFFGIDTITPPECVRSGSE